jgi:glycine betaine/proline transport system ATP-binding protein
MNTVKIRLQNLSKIFGEHPQKALALLDQGLHKADIFKQTGQAVGVANATFDVYEGEILVIMGLSGSGKSTLVRCINRLNDITSGHLFIDDVDITTLDHQALLELRRKKFGMVFQHFALFPHRTILQNAEYGLEIQGMPQAEREAKARSALELVGLAGWEDAMPSQLSGGMQQRVGLARALAVEPDILLMDEAFSALDPLIRRDMQYELVSLQTRVKKTIVFITHDLDEAINIGNRIVLMKDGEVVQIGTAEEILTSPASDYVERFVESVDVSRILTAQAVLARPRAVAYPGDGPRTVLKKMEDETLSNILVVNPSYQYEGVVTADAANEAIKKGEKTIEARICRNYATGHPDTPLSTLITWLAECDDSVPIPIVDQDSQKLQGLVVKGAVLSALSHHQLEMPSETSTETQEAA